MTESGLNVKPATAVLKPADGPRPAQTWCQQGTAHLHWLTVGTSLPAKAIRFGLVGATSSLIYVIAAAALIHFDVTGQKLASALAYLISMPVNFIGNRNFSFRSQDHVIGDAIRYCGVHLANMAVAAGSMVAATDVFHLHYGFGIAGAVILVPPASFILMNWFVFKKQLPRPDRTDT